LGEEDIARGTDAPRTVHAPLTSFLHGDSYTPLPSEAGGRMELLHDDLDDGVRMIRLNA